MKKFFSNDAIGKDFGLLVLRLGIGASIAIFHGYGKITAGPDMWTKLGGNMQYIHITAFPVFWGFMSAFAESICSILLVLGPLFRPAALLLAFNMFMAVMTHLHMPADQPMSGWNGATHALDLLIVYLCLFFTGPGKFAFKLGKAQ